MTDFDSIVNSNVEFDFYGVDNECFCIGKEGKTYVYEAISSESDGYRSYLETTELKSGEGKIFFHSPIAKVKVVSLDDVNYEDSVGYTVKHVQGYALVDGNGHYWVFVGTSYHDQWYPYFVFEYNPDRNQEVKD